MSELSLTAHEVLTEFEFSEPLSEPWVLVEGESDVAFLWEYTTDENCVLIDTDGKSEIVEVLSSETIRGQSGIVGIVDADLWLITQPPELRLENLLCDLDFPDIEVLLMSSRALRKSLRHDVRRIPKVTVPVVRIENFADQLATQACRLSMEFGYFRLLNDTENSGINFDLFWKHHQLDEFIDKQELTVDRDWFARRLADHHRSRWKRKPERWIPFDELLHGVFELEKVYPLPDKRLCRGKDAIAIGELIGPSLFESEFRTVLSSQQMRRIGFEDLSTELRKSFEYIHFVGTSLYSRIRAWESESEGFRILLDNSSM